MTEINVTAPTRAVLTLPGSPPAPSEIVGRGSVTATLALLNSPDFLELPASDPVEVARRVQELRDDWDGD